MEYEFQPATVPIARSPLTLLIIMFGKSCLPESSAEFFFLEKRAIYRCGSDLHNIFMAFIQ